MTQRIAEEEVGAGEVLVQYQREVIELEVISSSARLRLTRLLRRPVDNRDTATVLIEQNSIINLANTVLNRPMYKLELDDWGDYHNAEYGWHLSELELILRRPTTVQLVEILADLITQRWLNVR